MVFKFFVSSQSLCVTRREGCAVGGTDEVVWESGEGEGEARLFIE